MVLKVPNCSEVIILNILWGHWMSPLNYLTIHLFSNPHTPAEDDECDEYWLDYQEAVYLGYSAITLNAWEAPYTESTGRTRIQHPCVNWIGGVGAAVEIYGYYVLEGATLRWAWRDPDGPILMQEGRVYSVAPIFEGITEN